LPLLLLLQLDNIGLEVSRRRKGTRNVTNEVGLLGSKFEKLLRLLE
jgi:hypothetical protein